MKRTGWMLKAVRYEGETGKKTEEWERIGGDNKVVLVQGSETCAFFVTDGKGFNLAAGEAPSRDLAWFIATGIR